MKDVLKTQTAFSPKPALLTTKAISQRVLGLVIWFFLCCINPNVETIGQNCYPEITPPGGPWSEVRSTGMDGNGNMYYVVYSSINDEKLFRFDGSTWTEITPVGTTWVRISEGGRDSSGDIYFRMYPSQGNSKIYRYDGSTWTDVTPTGASLGLIYFDGTDDNGNIYYRTNILSNDRKLYRTDGGTVIEITPTGGPWRSLSERGLDDSGNKYYGAQNSSTYNVSLFLYDGNIMDDITPTGGPWKAIGNMVEDSNGEIYFRTYSVSYDEKLYRYDGSTWTDITPPTGGTWSDIYKGITDGNGNMFFSMRASGNVNKLYHYDGSIWTDITPTGGPWSKIVTKHFLKDVNGNRFFVMKTNSGNEKLYRSDGSTVMDITPSGGPWSDIRGRGIDGSGNIYFSIYSSTNGFKLYRYDGSTLTNITPTGGPWTYTWPAGMDDSENIYFVVGNKLYRYDGSLWTDITPTGGPWVNYESLGTDGYGNVYFWAFPNNTQQTLFRYDGSIMMDITPIGNIVYDMDTWNSELDANGHMYIQMYSNASDQKLFRSDNCNGLLSYDNDLFSESLANDGSISNQINITLNYENFSGTNGEDFVATSKVLVSNLPAGLSVNLIRQSDTEVLASITGNANNHDDINDVFSLTFDFQSSAFAGIAPSVDNPLKNDLKIDFICNPPIANCKNHTAYLDNSGMVSISTSDVDDGSTASCGLKNITLDETDFDCAHIGIPQNVTLTITDDNDVIDQCIAIVTFQDNIKPTISCQNKTLALDSNGAASISESDVLSSKDDNCGVPEISLSQSNFDCNDIGEMVVTVTADDGNGNTETCDATLTIEDDTKPVLHNCPANISKAMESGQCGAIVTWTSPSAADNCDANPSVTQTSGQTSGSFFNEGTQTIEYKATDLEGNESLVCSFTVTVQADAEKPVLSNCPSNITKAMDTGQCGATVTWTAPSATDNCDATPIVAQTSGLSSGSFFNEGTQTIEYKATDLEGNESLVCSFSITVEADAENPILQNCPSNITQAMDAGQCGATISWTAPGATDNCDANPTVTQTSGQTSGSFFNEGSQTIEYKATDSEGNESLVCSFSITVEVDAEKPNFNGTCANYLTAFNTDLDECFATMSFTVPNPSDNCGVTELKAKIWDSNGAVVQNWTTNPDGQYAPDTYQIKWRAKDAAGNKKTCAKTFTVQDVQNPNAQCVANHVVQLSGGTGSITTADIDAGSSDNCTVNMSLSQTSFDCDDRGMTSVTLTVTDDAGNIDQCTTAIEVKGTTLTINDISQNEGNGTGFTFFFFKIERAESGCTDQVDYETTDGAATLSDNDYVQGSGTAYFTPGGSNIRYVICRSTKDSKHENDEDFWVEMKHPTVGVSFGKDKGEGMIKNDDAAPLIGNGNENSNTVFSATQTLEGFAKLFPNPANKDLNISIPNDWLEAKSIEVTLLNVFGKRIATFEMSEDHTVVDVSALMVGSYQVIFTMKDGRNFVEKFVKVGK